MESNTECIAEMYSVGAPILAGELLRTRHLRTNICGPTFEDPTFADCSDIFKRWGVFFKRCRKKPDTIRKCRSAKVRPQVLAHHSVQLSAKPFIRVRVISRETTFHDDFRTLAVRK
jgi:hypothetical protein